MANLLSMLCPSRGRPRMLAQLAQSIADTATARGVELLVYLDADDSEVGLYRQTLAPYKFVHITVAEPLTVARALNVLAAKARGELLMLAHDDLACQSVGWDRVLRKEAGRFADGIFVIRPNDGAKQYCAFPVVSRKWYETLGYFAPEQFEFDCADRWLADVARKLDRLHGAPSAKLIHQRPTGGVSATARMRQKERAARDRTLYVTLAAKRGAAADKLRQLIEVPVPVQPPAVTPREPPKRAAAPEPTPAPEVTPEVTPEVIPESEAEEVIETQHRRWQERPGSTPPKILHFIWIGGDLPDYGRFIMDMWHELNPEYEIRLHGEEVLRPEYQPIYDRLTWPATKADVLKWSALRSHGGYTLDLDTIPLRPMITFTGQLHDAPFIAVDVPPQDRQEGRLRCDMGFIGARLDARIWAAVAWYLGGNAEQSAYRAGPLGGTRCMEWLLKQVPHLFTRFPATLYCPYSCRDKVWMPRGRRFYQAVRAGRGTKIVLAQYNEAFNCPLAWHVWKAAVKDE